MEDIPRGLNVSGLNVSEKKKGTFIDGLLD